MAHPITTPAIGGNEPARQYARAKETARHFRISRATLWRWVSSHPTFPKPAKAGQRVTLFDLGAIEAWIQKGAAQ